MELVTGYGGKAHITPENWADLNRGFSGADSYVMGTGRKFEAELISNNLLKIHDGCGIMQGRQVVIPKGLSDEVAIENGTQGMKRIDLIVERYTKNPDTKIETTETVIIKGTPSVNPAVPLHTEGDIRSGDMKADWPLYEVELSGLNIVAVKPLFKVLLDMSTINKDLSELSAYEKITLKDGVHLTRYGKLRVLSLVNASSPTAGDIVRLPLEDTPSNYVMSAASLRGQTRGDFFISITPADANPPGKVGIFTGNNEAQVVSGGYIVACVTWCV